MKIAFDVKGTLDGPKKRQVLMMFRLFKEAGHEMFVWSNAYTFATDAVTQFGLDAEAMPKRSKSDYGHEQNQYMDIAVEDDRRQTYLAAKKFVFVDDIPNTSEGVETLVKSLLVQRPQEELDGEAFVLLAEIVQLGKNRQPYKDLLPKLREAVVQSPTVAEYIKNLYVESKWD